MSEREWEYYKLKDQQCSQVTQDKVKNDRQIVKEQDNSELYCCIIFIAAVLLLELNNQKKAEKQLGSWKD